MFKNISITMNNTLVFLLLINSLFAQQFTKITTGDIVNDAYFSYGSAWGDYNNDDNLDLFVSVQYSVNDLLYKNNGDSTFTKITSTVVTSDGSRTNGGTWGDYNNDGFLDLFVVRDDGNNYLYKNNGNETFTKITSGAIVTDGGASVGASWGDYNNDGFLDLYVANGTSSTAYANFLYKNNGNETFTKITTGSIVTDLGKSASCFWIDYNNDGYLDLFVTNWGNNSLYKNNGNETFTKITSGAIVNDGLFSNSASWGDYDNDGDLDLIVTNGATSNYPSDFQQATFYKNNGDGTFSLISNTITNDVASLSIGSGWGDYDNDGDIDLMVVNTTAAIGSGLDNYFYENNGDGSFTKITGWNIVTDVSDSRGVSWGDYNNDGFLDMFVTNESNQNNFLYKNNGNSNNWTNIKCVGTVSNKSAIGAKVKLKASINGSDIWQIHEISAQTGRYSQSSLNVEFGLGNASIIDSIIIYWPSGIVWDTTNVAVNQFMTITEQSQFTKITTGDIVNDAASTFGVSWTDYDNDGNLDVFAANVYSENDNLYHNSGDGTFAKITSGVLVTDGKFSESATWGDYDNDGDMDVFVANGNNQSNNLYRNDGGGTFTKITTGNIVTDIASSIGSAWGDYDNDGYLDLFVVNHFNQANYLYHNEQNGTFTKITSGSIVTDLANSISCVWGDYDNDGYLDMFVANIDAPNNLYKNNGNGSFTKITSGSIVTDNHFSAGGSWGDYDNDGDLDLFVTNGKTGNAQKNDLYRNNGDGTFTSVTTAGAMVNDIIISSASTWGDYDNDGYIDLFVSNTPGVSGNLDNNLYKNNKDGTFTSIVSEILSNDGGASKGAAWGDYDNDGDLDLYVGNEVSQLNFLYQNNGNSNNWTNIKCIGTISNKSAIGAKVKVKANVNGNSFWQLQEVSSQTGYLSQNSINAEFGLGNATQIDSIIIYWPSGIVWDTTNVAVNQFMTITEPSITVCQPTADFSYTINGLTVTFTNSSVSYGTTSYLWNFGDGFLSGLKNPVYSFDSAIVYTVCFQVTDSCGISQTCKQVDLRGCSTQDCVWPGDANDNGIANIFDIFPIGLGYGTSGPQRSNPSNDWVGQFADNWIDTFRNGTNYKHADCNGDGLINLLDIIPLGQNYGKTHSKTSDNNSGGENDPPLYMELSTKGTNSGTLVTAVIKLGSDSLPIDSLYAIAFCISYDPALIDSGSMSFGSTNSWIGDISNSFTTSHEFHDEGTFEIGMTRIDHQNISGLGTIGTLSFFITDNLDGKKEEVMDIVLDFCNVSAIVKNENEVPVNLKGDTVAVYPTGIAAEYELDRTLLIFPNPSNESIYITSLSGDNKIISIELIDLKGAKLAEQTWTNPQSKVKTDVSQMPSGIYLLKAKLQDQLVIYQRVSIMTAY